MPSDGSLGGASYSFWQQSTQPGYVSFYLCKHQKGSLPDLDAPSGKKFHCLFYARKQAQLSRLAV